ncbi:hypothetical protein L209DRAFT_749962 [Thermothelomyces heterothallicus CBS 203.75]
MTQSFLWSFVTLPLLRNPWDFHRPDRISVPRPCVVEVSLSWTTLGNLTAKPSRARG